jgi:hypothetical protein
MSKFCEKLIIRFIKKFFHLSAPLYSAVAFLACLGVALAATNYCDKKLCGANVPHIGCKNPGKLGVNCSADASFVTLTAKQVDLFLDLHNKKRALIASGALTNFTSATKMSVVVSDFLYAIISLKHI